MSRLEFEKFNINQFWETSPTTLKYIIVISLIVVGSYFLYAKKANEVSQKQISKIEESISTTYTLINRFDDFKEAQFIYNDEILNNLNNIYILVEELNENTNKKFDILLKAGGKNTDEIIDKITLLNETFEKLQKAYEPKENNKPKDKEFKIVATPSKDKK